MRLSTKSRLPGISLAAGSRTRAAVAIDGLEPPRRRDGTLRVDGPRKRDRLKFDSVAAETIQAGLIDRGRRLGLFRRREVVRPRGNIGIGSRLEAQVIQVAVGQQPEHEASA